MFLKIFGVKISYSNNEALSNITLEVDDGINIIIGKNGVGKSSLVAVAEGLTRINNKNNVLIEGIKVYNKPAKAFKNTAFLPEKPFPLSGQTVKDWIRIYSMLREIERIRLKKLLDYFDINYVLNQKCKNLSMGETQLISFILCLSSKAKYFVLDEPNANIDALNRIKMANVITKMKEENGSSFLICSHILDELMPIADRIISFRKSSISTPIPNQFKDKFLIIRGANNDNLCKSIENRIDYKRSGHEVLIKNSSIKQVIDAIDEETSSQIMSIGSFPSLLEEFFDEI